MTQEQTFAETHLKPYREVIKHELLKGHGSDFVHGVLDEIYLHAPEQYPDYVFVSVITSPASSCATTAGHIPLIVALNSCGYSAETLVVVSEQQQKSELHEYLATASFKGKILLDYDQYTETYLAISDNEQRTLKYYFASNFMVSKEAVKKRILPHYVIDYLSTLNHAQSVNKPSNFIAENLKTPSLGVYLSPKLGFSLLSITTELGDILSKRKLNGAVYKFQFYGEAQAQIAKLLPGFCEMLSDNVAHLIANPEDCSVEIYAGELPRQNPLNAVTLKFSSLCSLLTAVTRMHDFNQTRTVYSDDDYYRLNQIRQDIVLFKRKRS